MKWLSYILLVVLIYLICSAKGCTDDQNIRELNEEKQIEALKDSVRTLFEADSISDTFINAYQETARHKLFDFADYLKIVSDTSLDKEFREHAAALIRKMFISGEVEVDNLGIGTSKPGKETLNQLLDACLSDGIPSWISLHHIEVSEPLTMRNDSTLEGALSFNQIKVPYKSNISPDTINQMFLIDIYALKKVKYFDKEQIRIWEVFLGDIE